MDIIYKNIVESLYKKQLDKSDEIEYNALKCESNVIKHDQS